MTLHVPFSSRLGGLSKRARTLALGLATALGVAPLAAQAQLVLDSTTPKTETFDGLGTSATAALPAGFKLSADASPTYASATGTNTTAVTTGSNFTAGGAYNFGAAGSTDRALGFLNSSGYASPRSILLQVSNASGSTVQNLSVQFAYEKYRSGSRAFNWTFYTSTDGVNWTPQTAGDQAFGADANNTVYGYPISSSPETVNLSNLGLTDGASLYLRWTLQGVGGSTNGQAIGIDDLTLTPSTGSGTPAPAPTITTGTVSPTSLCVSSAAGSSLSVPFTATGTLGGTYSVQLSDASGAFANTTDNLIGTGSTSPIAATIPAGTASGTGYRVRVLNSSPATAGTDNGQGLTVSLAPTNTVTVQATGAQSATTTGTGGTLTASATLTGSTYTFQYSTSTGGTYTTLGSASGASYTLSGADFPGAGTYYVVAQATAATSCGNVTGTSSPITVAVTAPTAQPVVSVSATSLADFGNAAAGASVGTQSFTVGGTGLTGPLTITPPAGFEIRLAGSAFACCPIVLTPTSGTVPSTTIEVRFVPTAAQASAASITVTGSGQPTQLVAVSGTGIEAVYPATLGTTEVTALTATTATTGGTVATDGGSAVTARGVVYSTSATPTVLLTTKTSDGPGSGAFTSTLSGLKPATTYYVRAYATNAVGTTYGQELSFTTATVPLAAEPTTPATIAQGTLGGTSVQLLLGGGNGQKRLVVATLGGTAPTATPVDGTTYTASGTFGTGQALAPGAFVVYSGAGADATVTGLQPNAQYSFAVYAYNDGNVASAENYLATSPGTLTVTTPAAPAALLLEENFDYPAGALLSANNWTAHSAAGTNSVKVVEGSLSLGSYNTPSGNSAALSGSGEDVSRSFAPVSAGTPAYAAFLVKVTSATAAGDYFFHFGPQPLGTTFRARVFARLTASGKVQFGTSTGSGTVSYGTTEYDLGSTNLLVVKYLFDASSNSTALYVNPGATEPTTPSATTSEVGSPSPNIGTVALRQGSSSAPSLVVDGLRVGTTFAVVTTGQTGPACQAPVVTAPATITATTAYGQATASVSFAATATGTTPALTYSLVQNGAATAITSPYSFPVGTTTVTATATNGCGTSTATFAVTVQANTTASVSVLYANGSNSPTDGTVDPFLQLVNNTSAAIPYQELTVRYYLTVENFSPIQATVGYAELGTSGVQVRYVALPQPAQGALGYLEFSFTSAKALAANGNSGRILAHANKQNYSPFNEADDYSYAPNPAYAPNNRITVYRNGVLIGGVEPAPVTATAQLQAQTANQTTDDLRPTIDVVTQVNNLSSVAVPYQDLTVRYWFTPDGTSPLQGGVTYAQIGTSAVNLVYGQAGAQPYAEIRFDASLGNLAALGNSGQIIFHLNKANYSNFSQANDYSFRADNMLTENPRVTIYQQGQLVYGQEPAGATSPAGTASARAIAPSKATSSSLQALGSVFEAYPSPFTTEATLHFRAATSGPARLTVYNTLGQVVKTCFNGTAEAGQDYNCVLDGSSLSAGAYLVRLEAGGKTQTVRLMLAK